ncbi:phage/plasmid replication protein, II/X family [Moraxella bovis]|uniref:phage/plasmid replication protein, II/X family n=1 Tax=Moraxella bovis TaxID=476 RepID=UPI002227452A|nr:phage/plasmid replication protein, II/X family [Moraxella bovis]UYZ91024.1 phage/plasmid replication protein, II/X family [Moraxella bovis]UYZ91037.1 phage/plasmid replication protein, II/X family [Moraxella bovis]
MLDHLRLAVPVLPIYAMQMPSVKNEVYHFNQSLVDLGLACSARSVSRDDDGVISSRDLYIRYECLPSSYTDMAIKFFDKGINTLPYLELKASPAKLMQGHNVYGSQSIEQGAFEMLGLLIESHPQLCKYLDFDKTEVFHLDATFSARLPHQNQVQPVLDFLANVGKGHRKATYKAHENYVRWGNDGASISAKAYGKYLETQEQLKQFERQALKGDARAKTCAIALSKAYPFAHALLRFESRITKTYLAKNGYPTNLWELIKLQRATPTLLGDLWNVAFNPIFETLKGEHLMFKTDFEIEQLLKDKLKTITPKGRVSYTKAYNAMAFYRTIREKGFAQLHKEMRSGEIAERTFYHNIKLLCDCGISRSHLQNLHAEKSNVVPFVQLVQIDFSQQAPQGFVPPVSRYEHLFQKVA